MLRRSELDQPSLTFIGSEYLGLMVPLGHWPLDVCSAAIANGHYANPEHAVSTRLQSFKPHIGNLIGRQVLKVEPTLLLFKANSPARMAADPGSQKLVPTQSSRL